MTAQIFERPDATIAYWDEGPRHAPIIVFLHGAALDHRAWDPQVSALRDRYRVVTVDLRHHGASTARNRFRFEDAVADVIGLLDVLSPRKVVIVGLSLGGNIAQDVVRRVPHRVDALVVADTTCNAAPRRAGQKAAAIAAIRYLAVYPRWFFLRAAAQVTADDPAARKYVRAATATMAQRDVVRVLTSLVGTALRPDPHYQLPVPTLILHGERDRIGDIAAGSKRWAQKQSHAERAVVPSASHLSNLDAPEAFTRQLADFLHRHLPTAPEGVCPPTRHRRLGQIIPHDRPADEAPHPLESAAVAVRVACAHLSVGDLPSAQRALRIAHDSLPREALEGEPAEDQHASRVAPPRPTSTDRRAEEIAELQRCLLRDHARLDQAVGMLAQVGDTSTDHAMDLLREHAEHHRFVLTGLAADIITGRIHPTAIITQAHAPDPRGRGAGPSPAQMTGQEEPGPVRADLR